MTVLYHYTCRHGYDALQDGGIVKPAVVQNPTRANVWTGLFAWFTDLTPPIREPLGLTANFTACDRTEFRYRVDDPDSPDIEPWHVVARRLPVELRRSLEEAPGAMPMHWWVSQSNVAVTYDPMKG